MELYSSVAYPVGTKFITNPTELCDTNGYTKAIPEGSIATVIKVVDKKYSMPYYVYDIVINGVKYNGCGVFHFKDIYSEKYEYADKFWVEE